jgi:hypothetical protein
MRLLLVLPSIVTAYVCGPVLSGKVIGADHNLAAYSNISDPSECCSLWSVAASYRTAPRPLPR